jgi:hypothetical protein
VKVVHELIDNGSNGKLRIAAFDPVVSVRRHSTSIYPLPQILELPYRLGDIAGSDVGLNAAQNAYDGIWLSSTSEICRRQRKHWRRYLFNVEMVRYAVAVAVRICAGGLPSRCAVGTPKRSTPPGSGIEA